jgi:hypothetical protein
LKGYQNVQAVGVAMLLGLLWWKQKLDTNEDIQDQVSIPVMPKKGS